MLKWWFLCAIEEGCIAPTRELVCKFRGRREYAHCHRYEQSAFNILLANYFNDNYTAYFDAEARGPMMTYDRLIRDKLNVSVCNNNGFVRKIPTKMIR